MGSLAKRPCISPVALKRIDFAWDTGSVNRPFGETYLASPFLTRALEMVPEVGLEPT